MAMAPNPRRRTALIADRVRGADRRAVSRDRNGRVRPVFPARNAVRGAARRATTVRWRPGFGSAVFETTREVGDDPSLEYRYRHCLGMVGGGGSPCIEFYSSGTSARR